MLQFITLPAQQQSGLGRTAYLNSWFPAMYDESQHLSICNASIAERGIHACHHVAMN